MSAQPSTDRADPSQGKLAEKGKQERNDPESRPYDPMRAGTVRNKREDREYVLANPNDDIFGLARHIDDGWKEINHRTDRERVYSGREEGNGRVSFQGQVLLWIEKQKHQDRLDAAQAVVKARESKARGPGGIDSVIDATGKPAQLADNN